MSSCTTMKSNIVKNKVTEEDILKKKKWKTLFQS